MGFGNSRIDKLRANVTRPEFSSFTESTSKPETASFAGRPTSLLRRIINRLTGSLQISLQKNKRKLADFDNIAVIKEIESKIKPVKTSRKDRKAMIKTLQRKNFSSKQAQEIFKNIAKKSFSSMSLGNRIKDIPNKKYYDKGYKSQQEINDMFDNAIKEFFEKGYSLKDSEKALQQALDNAPSQEEFNLYVAVTINQKDASMGYKNIDQISHNKKIATNKLIALGYSEKKSLETVDRIHDNASTIDEFLTEIDDMPTADQEKKGYHIKSEIDALKDGFIKKLTRGGMSPKDAQNIANNLEEASDSKQSFAKSIVNFSKNKDNATGFNNQKTSKTSDNGLKLTDEKQLDSAQKTYEQNITALRNVIENNLEEISNIKSNDAFGKILDTLQTETIAMIDNEIKHYKNSIAELKNSPSKLSQETIGLIKNNGNMLSDMHRRAVYKLDQYVKNNLPDFVEDAGFITVKQQLARQMQSFYFDAKNIE